MRNLRLAVPALAVCMALSACGGQGVGDGTPTPTPTGAQPVTSAPSPDPTASEGGPSTGPTPPPPTALPRSPKPGGPTKPPPVGATELTGTVTAKVAPAEGRVLYGNVQVRTDTNILIGSGDVVVRAVN